MYTIKEINDGIKEANKIIKRELSYGDLANLTRVAKFSKYIAEMEQLRIDITK